MSLTVLLSIALTGFVLRLVLKARNINDILRWSIVFYLLMWIIAPGLSVLFLDALINEYGAILTQDFVELYVFESCLVSAVIMLYLKTSRGNQTMVKPWVRPEMFFSLAAIYLTWVMFTLFTQSSDYLVNNDASLQVRDDTFGSVSLIYVLLGAFFSYCALTTRDRVILLISFGLVVLTTIQNVLTGAAIGLVWPLFILMFRFWQPIRGGISSISRWRRLVSVSIIAALFIVMMALSASIRSTRSTQSVASGMEDFQIFDIASLASNLYSKFNSIDAGVALISGYGDGSAGIAPYRGSLIFFVPRFIYSEKPIAGSINDTVFGTPARLVPALVNSEDTINNVGVSPLAISVWHWGWLGGVVTFVVGGYVTLWLSAYMLNGPLLLRLLAFYLIPIPGFVYLMPSPDVALRNVMLVGFVVLALKLLGGVFGKPSRRREAKYIHSCRITTPSPENVLDDLSCKVPRMKMYLRTLYRALPFKRPVILAIRALGLGTLLPARLKPYLVFEGPFSVPVGGRSFQMLNGYGRQIESTVYWDGLGAFEDRTLRWWRILAKRSQVILDIGANTGIYALLAKTLQPAAEVHAFEPIARVHRILAANVALNTLAPPPVEVHRVALSDYTGEGQMFDLPVEHTYTASLNKDIHVERGQPMAACTEAVPVQRLDDFLNSNNCQRLDLIKIDVESHEPAVLRGLGDWLRRFHPSLIVEIWNNDVGAAVEAVLQGCDYLYFAITVAATESRAHICNDFPEQGYLNYLICTESVAGELGLLRHAT